MIKHIFLPGVLLEVGCTKPVYDQYLKAWREEAIQHASEGDIAASICLQGAFTDLCLFGKLNHDWIGIMDEFLMEGDIPLAYSKKFGARLSKFDAQYKQSTIHAIHTRWWIECINEKGSVDHDRYANLITSKKQTDGLIYDRDVSETTLRHRMKVELTMSMAFAAEILHAAGRLNATASLELATNITSPLKCPALGYMSMEYFRMKSLELLGYEQLFPVGIEKQIEACTDGLSVGWSDFAVSSKVDAYMGTAKRTKRDKIIHSPLIGCHVSALFSQIKDNAIKSGFADRLTAYGCYLRNHSTDIPAFQMRDVPIKFGADKTPIEVICASYLITLCEEA